jgi:hypothetical protein
MPDRQIQNRAEMNWDEDEPDPRPARDSFTPLFGQPEQGGYLPSKDDQSWREQEALRLGYFTPRADVSQKTDWAAAPPAREMIPIEEDPAPPEVSPDEVEVPDEKEEAPESEAVAEGGDFTPRREFAMPEPGRRNRGRILLVSALLAATAAIAIAFPHALKISFWKGEAAKVMPNSQTASIPSMRRVPDKSASAPMPSAVAPATAPRAAEPVPSPRASPDAGGNRTQAATRGVPPAMEPAPLPQSNPKAGEDAAGAAVPAAPAPELAVRPRQRAATPENSPGSGQDGFYAMVPGPDGTMTYRYFSADPEPKSGAGRANSRTNRTDREDRGVYAKAPGPDGRMEYRYFPPPPAR